MTLKKYFLCLLMLLAGSSSVSAQYDPWWQWARADTNAALSYAGGGSVLATRGGKALWGYPTANQTVVNGTVMGTWTLFEYDSTGARKGAAAFGGKVELIDVQADTAGNWYVLGRFYDSLVLPTTTLVRPNPALNTDADHFMFRLNAGSLYMPWFRLISAVNSVSSRAFTVDNSKIILAADSSDATYVRSLALATGNVTPMFRQGGKSTTTSIQADAAGNIYMAGSCANKGSIDFNGKLQPVIPGRSFAYIVKYGPAGGYRWHHWLNDPACAQRKLSLYKNQFLFYTGTIHDSLTLGLVPVHQPLRSLDYISARLDTGGFVMWVKQVDTVGGGEAYLGTGAFHATVTPDTALVIFAQANSFLDWGDGVSTNLFGTYSSVVVSRGSGGETRWARSILAENTTDAHIAGEGDGVWVCGNAFSTSAFVTMDTLKLRVAARKWVPYLGKLRLTRPLFVNAVGGIAKGADATALPNPARNTVRVAGLSGRCTLVINDLNGRVVLETSTDKAEAVLDVAGLARGVYYLQMRGANGETQVRKLLLQ